MKKFIFLLLLSVFSLTSYSCTGTKDKSPDEKFQPEKLLTQTEKLVLTAKVWGFLK